MSTTRAADFIDTIGVNTHINYTDGHYVQTGKVLSALDYLGISNLRDAAPLSGGQGQGSLARVADAGYKFDFITTLRNDEKKAFADIDAFLAKHPGSISAIEGPNEIDNYRVSYQGKTGVEAAVAIQKTIYDHVNGNSRYDGIQVYNLTNSTSISAPADYANVHSYSKNGDQGIEWLRKDMARQIATQSHLPVVLTETGFADVKTTSGWEGVDQPTQAKLTLNLLMDSSKLGIERVYLYELLDAYQDPTGKSVGKHLGLFDYDYNPKPVATAIHNLTTILTDRGENAESFATTALDYGVSGLSANASSMLLEKSTGVHDIVLWADPDIWDEAKDVSIAAPVQKASVDFHGQLKIVHVYDPLVSDKAIATYDGVTSVQVAVSDHPVILEVQDAPGLLPVGTLYKNLKPGGVPSEVADAADHAASSGAILSDMLLTGGKGAAAIASGLALSDAHDLVGGAVDHVADAAMMLRPDHGPDQMMRLGLGDYHHLV